MSVGAANHASRFWKTSLQGIGCVLPGARGKGGGAGTVSLEGEKEEGKAQCEGGGWGVGGGGGGRRDMHSEGICVMCCRCTRWVLAGVPTDPWSYTYWKLLPIMIVLLIGGGREGGAGEREVSSTQCCGVAKLTRTLAIFLDRGLAPHSHPVAMAS